MAHLRVRDDDAYAIVSVHDDVRIVHYRSSRTADAGGRPVLGALSAWGRAQWTKLLLYTPDRVFAAMAAGAYFESAPGYITIHSTAEGRAQPEGEIAAQLLGTSWDMQDGDKM